MIGEPLNARDVLARWFVGGDRPTAMDRESASDALAALYDHGYQIVRIDPETMEAAVTAMLAEIPDYWEKPRRHRMFVELRAALRVLGVEIPT